jgi:hypothetical protein
LSRGAAGAAEASLQGNLSVLRKAIEFYQTEQGGLIPKDENTIVAQLTTYTDIQGNTNPTKSSTYLYGPYLRAVPALPVGKNKGSTAVRDGGSPGDGSEGWHYDKDTGNIVANTKDDEVDAAGVSYNTY